MTKLSIPVFVESSLHNERIIVTSGRFSAMQFTLLPVESIVSLGHEYGISLSRASAHDVECN